MGLQISIITMKNLLRILLAVIGIVIVLLGLNVSLGGIQTLGWQGVSDFFVVTDAEAFAVQDNHIRFIAGVWTGVGAYFVAAALMPQQLSPALKAMIVLVAFGGIARLFVLDSTLLMSQQIAPSLVAELVLFPLLGWWIHKTQWGPS